MVWKEGLVYKLRNLGVGRRMLAWIGDFLTDRKIRVRVGSEISEVHHMHNGTPQGSIISPILFNIMMNDLPNPNDMRISTSIYADDCAA